MCVQPCLLIVSTLSLSVLLTSARAVTLVDDGFETTTHPGGDRTAATATGLPFYTRALSGTLTLGIANDATFNSNVLSFDDTTAGSQSEGVIAPISTSINLNNTGDFVTLSFSFRYTNNGTAQGNNSNFRFGLFNSQGTAVTGDNQGASVNDTGYYVQVGSGGIAPLANNVLYEELGGTAPILAGTDRANKVASADGIGLNDDVIHTASFTLTRSSATTMGLSLTIDSVTLTASDTSTLITSIDQLAFANGFSTTGLDFMIDNVVVTSNVPEPRLAVLLALSAGACVLRRQRRSRRTYSHS